MAYSMILGVLAVMVAQQAAPAFSEGDIAKITVLVYGSGIAAVSWLARALTDTRPKGIDRYLGGMLGAAIAAFSFGALVGETLRPTYILGLCGVVGWAGGEFLGVLAKVAHKWLEAGAKRE